VVAEREVCLDEPPVLLQRGGERRLRRLGLETADQEARGDPAAFERAGGAQQVVPAVGDELVADLAAAGDVDGEVGAGWSEAVKTLVGEISQAREEAPPQEVEQREDDVNSYVDSWLCGAGSGMPDRRAGEEPRRGDDPVRRALHDGRVSDPRESSMRVRRGGGQGAGDLAVELLDDAGQPVAVVSSFLRHLAARGCSPNTVEAYAYDLGHFWRFLGTRGLSWQFWPAHALELLEALRVTPSSRRAQRLGLSLATTVAGRPALRLAPATVNRALAAVSSFYEYAVLSGRLARENPIEQRPDRAAEFVSDRYRPFMDGASRQRPVRRTVRVKTVQAVPRPLDDQQVAALFGALRCRRDRALLLLMLDGGLRPGEALGMCLEDVAYGRRRVVVRCREDHPKGVRLKSRRERVVDLHEPTTLAAVSDYVMTERPADAESPYLFVVGGRGARRLEPLGYDALAKLFARACERAGIRAPWVTAHALRHTHATRMWEGGMRELTLQKRLGHASPEATRTYTRVSDREVLADYRRALGGPSDDLPAGGAAREEQSR